MWLQIVIMGLQYSSHVTSDSDVFSSPQTYLPHSIKKIFFTQELCIVFWKLFELNQVRVSILPSREPSFTLSLSHTITHSPPPEISGAHAAQPHTVWACCSSVAPTVGDQNKPRYVTPTVTFWQSYTIKTRASTEDVHWRFAFLLTLKCTYRQTHTHAHMNTHAHTDTHAHTYGHRCMHIQVHPAHTCTRSPHMPHTHPPLPTSLYTPPLHSPLPPHTSLPHSPGGYAACWSLPHAPPERGEKLWCETKQAIHPEDAPSGYPQVQWHACRPSLPGKIMWHHIPSSSLCHHDVISTDVIFMMSLLLLWFIYLRCHYDSFLWCNPWCHDVISTDVIV